MKRLAIIVTLVVGLLVGSLTYAYKRVRANYRAISQVQATPQKNLDQGREMLRPRGGYSSDSNEPERVVGQAGGFLATNRRYFLVGRDGVLAISGTTVYTKHGALKFSEYGGSHYVAVTWTNGPQSRQDAL